jgi:predicted phosphodiesterase
MKPFVWKNTLTLALAVGLAACASPAVTPTPVLPIVESSTLPPSEAPNTTPSPALTSTATQQPTVTPFPEAVPSTEITYAIPPTAQHVTETGATIFFELSAPAAGQLLYRAQTDPADGGAVPLDPENTRQIITLEGLTPGQRYDYVIRLGADGAPLGEPTFDGSLWGPTSFHTPPYKEPLRFGVIGDSGFGEEVTFRLGELMAASDLDFVIHVGDVVYRIAENASPFEAYALKYYTPFAPVLREMPIYPVVGNHDVEAAAFWGETPFYYYVFPPFPDSAFAPSDYDGRRQWVAFAVADIQFVLLDTQTFFGEAGGVEQDAWLADRLADERFRLTIPVCHVPVYSSGPHAGDAAVVRANWAGLFEAAHAPLVLSGHDHDYERLSVNGVTYIVSGGGSTALYTLDSPHPGSQFFATLSHFVLVEVYPSVILLSAIGADGVLIDQANIPLE